MDQASRLISILKSKNQTIGSCESLTAGLFSATLAGISGASAVLKGGLITYYTPLKTKLAHVDPQLIERYGVISKECAQAMAENARVIMDVDYCVSFTGNAGPQTMENKPVGLIYCAIASKNDVKTYCFQYENLERNACRQQVVKDMIDNCILYINKE